jgi:Protein of unknown function (DUF2786)
MASSMTISDSLLDKIRALLAMAEHPNSNEHEAALALERAQALLFANNLSRADIKSDSYNATPAGIGKIDGIEQDGFSWKILLLNTLAKATLCRIVIGSRSKTWHIFGTYDNVQTTLEMYHWVIPQLETMAINGWLAYKTHGYEPCRTFKTGFYNGAIHTIKERLQKPLDDFTYGNGKAIVLYNDKAVTMAVSKIFPRLGHTSYGRTSSYDGVSAGRTAGQNVTLTPQRKLTNTLALNAGH